MKTMATGTTERQQESLSYQQWILRFEKEATKIASDKNTKMKIRTKWFDRGPDATNERILNKFRIKHRETKQTNKQKKT